jgi:hypothetical protein
MTDLVKPMLGTTLGLQSLSLMGRSVGTMNDMFNPKTKNKGKKLIGGFTDVLVGTAILKPTADIVSSF